MQTNSDRETSRQGDIFEGADRQATFAVLSTCEKAVGIVRKIKGTMEDGNYQFSIAVIRFCYTDGMRKAAMRKMMVEGKTAEHISKIGDKQM